MKELFAVFQDNGPAFAAVVFVSVYKCLGLVNKSNNGDGVLECPWYGTRGS